MAAAASSERQSCTTSAPSDTDKLKKDVPDLHVLMTKKDNGKIAMQKAGKSYQQ